jgi:hypothetical protein
MRVLRCGSLVALSVCAAACGDERPPLCPEAYFDGELPVAATTVSTADIQAVTAHTTSNAGGVTVDIVGGQGTVSYEGRGPIPAFIFSTIPWPLIDRTLFAGLGVKDGVWYPFWLYCSDDGRLTEFDGEMTDRDVAVLTSLEGTCVLTRVDAPFTIPAHSLRNVALSCGFTVTAPVGARALDLGSSRAGSADIGAGRSAVVLPFHTVDCRECGSPGWYELHALVADPGTQWAAFVVYYLDDPGSVSAGNGFQLPNAAPYADFYRGAVWELIR